MPRATKPRTWECFSLGRGIGKRQDEAVDVDLAAAAQVVGEGRKQEDDEEAAQPQHGRHERRLLVELDVPARIEGHRPDEGQDVERLPSPEEHHAQHAKVEEGEVPEERVARILPRRDHHGRGDAPQHGKDAHGDGVVQDGQRHPRHGDGDHGEECDRLGKEVIERESREQGHVEDGKTAPHEALPERPHGPSHGQVAADQERDAGQDP
jgi:hypothetical protein